MEDQTPIKVVTVSGACCMPHLAQADRVLAKTLKEAITSASIPVEVRKVSLSGILANSEGLTPKQQASIMALFNRYGAACAPAVFIGEELKFAGKQPTVEQLKDALAAASN